MLEKAMYKGVHEEKPTAWGIVCTCSYKCKSSFQSKIMCRPCPLYLGITGVVSRNVVVVAPGDGVPPNSRGVGEPGATGTTGTPAKPRSAPSRSR